MGQENSRIVSNERGVINKFEDQSRSTKRISSRGKYGNKRNSKNISGSGSNIFLPSSTSEGKSQQQTTTTVSTLSQNSPRHRQQSVKHGEACCNGHLVFMNGSIFEGHICSKLGNSQTTFLTHHGECLKGTWKLISFRYDTRRISPLAVYATELLITTVNDGQVNYVGAVAIELKTGELRLLNHPTLLKKSHCLQQPISPAPKSKVGLPRTSSEPPSSCPKIRDSSSKKTHTYTETTSNQEVCASDVKTPKNREGIAEVGRKILLSQLDIDDIVIESNQSRPFTTTKAESNLTAHTHRDYNLIFWSLYGKNLSLTRWDEEIKQDIDRAQFSNFDRGETEIVRRQLADVLNYIALSFPGIGYCQGMDHLVKYMLTFYSTPVRKKIATSEMDRRVILQTEAVFVFFSQLLEDPQYRMSDLFSPGFILLHALLDELDSRLSKVEPVLHTHLCENLVTPMLYATKWFLTVFSFYSEQDLNSVSNVWLRFLSQGWDAVIDVAVACVTGVKELLLNSDMEECLYVLSGNSSFTERGMLARVFSTERGQAVLLLAAQYRRGSDYLYKYAAAYASNHSIDEELLPFTSTRKKRQSITSYFRRNTAAM